MPYYVAFSLFACLPALPACFPCLLTDWTGLFVKQISLTSVPFSLSFALIVFPCQGLPFSPENFLRQGLKIPPKIPRMSTKIAVFAVYRSENGPKKVVNTQIHKCFDKIFCADLTNDLHWLTNFWKSNFYRAHKNAISTAPKMQNAAKNAGLILAVPTGQGENPNPDGRNTAQHDRQGRR